MRITTYESGANRRGSVVLTLGIAFRRCGEKIQSEFVIPQSNVTWLETGANEHRPQIAFAVIHFMIVDLHFRTESEPEGGQFEESFPAPRRDIYQQQTRASKQAPHRLDDKLRLSQVFQHRDEHDDVHGFAFEVWQGFFDRALMECEFLQRLQFRCDLEIHPDASHQLWFQGD